MTPALTVLFVCSNDIHVRTFAPVARELQRGNAGSVFLSLDGLYHQGATNAARSLGIEIEDVGAPRAGRSAFYRRSAISVWSDVLRARTEIRTHLRAHPASCLVVGNDRGLIERAWLHEARSRGMRTILVQDGQLFDQLPAPETFKGMAWRSSKGLASTLFRRVGLGSLAASRYGEGGADVICASGDDSAALLARRAGHRSKVVVTGQPRYDDLPARDPSPARWTGPVVFFTTPYAHAGLEDHAQERQEALAVSLGAAFASAGWRFLVKPHPREEAWRYEQMIPNSATTRTTPDLIAEASAAIVGPSTVAEEAAIIGCPVIVPSFSPAGHATSALLPNGNAYPRFRDASAAVTLVDRIASDAEWRQDLIAQQRALVRRRVLTDGAAAPRVAEAIVG